MAKPGIEELIAGADAGAYGLPTWLRTALEARDRLTAAASEASARLNEHRGNLQAVHNRTVREAIDRARLNKSFHGITDAVDEVEHEQQRVAVHARVIGQAAETAGAELRSLLDSRADDLIRETLQPALKETMTQAREALAALEGIEIDASVIITAGVEKHRKAWKALTQAAQRYEAIRRAQDVIHRQRRAKPQDPALMLFKDYRDHRTPSVYSAADGFPKAQPQKLVEIISAGWEPWVPTLAEQNDRARYYVERKAAAVS
jgi:hypothetical protein